MGKSLLKAQCPACGSVLYGNKWLFVGQHTPLSHLIKIDCDVCVARIVGLLNG